VKSSKLGEQQEPPFKKLRPAFAEAATRKQVQVFVRIPDGSIATIFWNVKVYFIS